MKKLRLIAILLLVMITASSCQFTSFDANTLLTAPLMNPGDQAIQKSIADLVGVVNIFLGTSRRRNFPLNFAGDCDRIIPYEFSLGGV